MSNSYYLRKVTKSSRNHSIRIRINIKKILCISFRIKFITDRNFFLFGGILTEAAGSINIFQFLRPLNGLAAWVNLKFSLNWSFFVFVLWLWYKQKIRLIYAIHDCLRILYQQSLKHHYMILTRILLDMVHDFMFLNFLIYWRLIFTC